MVNVNIGNPRDLSGEKFDLDCFEFTLLFIDVASSLDRQGDITEKEGKTAVDVLATCIELMLNDKELVRRRLAKCRKAVDFIDDLKECAEHAKGKPSNEDIAELLKKLIEVASTR